MTHVPVAVYTRDGNRWQVDDTDADVAYVVNQLDKVKWLPVLGPLEGGTQRPRMLAGYVRTSHVLGVFPERAQP